MILHCHLLRRIVSIIVVVILSCSTCLLHVHSFQINHQTRVDCCGNDSHHCYTKKKKNLSITSLESTINIENNIIVDDDDDDDSTTTCTLTSPSGQEITLIGTAHHSIKSADQVKRLLGKIRPNVIMIEADPSRAVGIAGKEGGRRWRKGMKTLRATMGKEKTIRTAEDIRLPVEEKDEDVPWLVRKVQNAVLSIATAQVLDMYQGEDSNMSELLNTKNKRECPVALDMAKELAECHTVVLGDRSLTSTIRRTVKLGMELHDDDDHPLGFLERQEKAMEEELTQLEEHVRTRLEEEKPAGSVDEAEVQVAMMETVKKDEDFRRRLLRKLDEEVPEYTQAVQKERDYIMAESIRRELDAPNVERVVGVVGLAHVPGMVENLNAMFANEPVPLERMKLAP